MATPGAEFTTLRPKVPASPTPLRPVEVELESELQELENKIVDHRDPPVSALLMEVVERVRLLTGADGAAIAVCDPLGIICRASVGQAPEIGSRLHPDSALTRECFETGQIVICEDTETDYRVRRSTAKSLHLRSAVVVPLQARSSVLGVIEVLSSLPYAFSATHIAGLQRLGESLAGILPAEPAPAGPGSVEPEPAEPSEPPPENVLAVPPLRPEQFVEIVPAPVAILPPTAKPKAKLGPLLAIVLLLLIPLLYFAVRAQQGKAPSTPAAVPAPATQTAGLPLAQPQSIPQPTTGTSPLAPDVSPHPALPTATSTALPGSAQPEAERSAAVPEKSPAGNQAAVIHPAVPAVVIQGVLPGTQVFVDNKLVASTDPSGQASISTLTDGGHDLRLRFNGYRDYERSLDVQPGKTATVTAKLEPLEPPAFSERPKAPVLAVTPAIPEPVTSTRISPPNFALDHTLKAHSSWVTAVAFSPDGQRLVSGSWDQTVKFWEVTSGKQLSPVASKIKEIQSLAFSRDGHWLATENSSNTVALRDPVTGKEIRALPSDKTLGPLGSNWVYSIAFSPDGKLLASGLDDKTVRLWDVNTGRKVRDLTGLRRPVIYIAFNPDGRLLATGDDEKTIRIWDVATGEEILKLSGHKKVVNAVAFRPDGHWLASASADKTVKLWDLVTGREIRTLTGHGSSVTSLAFSADGHWLASGSWDKTIKVWDAETGREVQSLSGHNRPVYSVAYDSGGHWLASGSEDGTIKLWRLDNAADRSELR